MGSKNDPGNFDCYHNALPDEPMFILLARDPSAPELVADWATERQRQIDKGWRPKSDQAMVDEAIRCAGYMKHWRVVNNGAWRDAHPQPQQADGRGAVIEKALQRIARYPFDNPNSNDATIIRELAATALQQASATDRAPANLLGPVSRAADGK